MAFSIEDLNKINLALLAQRSAVMMSADSFRNCGDAFDGLAHSLYADAAAIRVLEEKVFAELAILRRAEMMKTV
jgi:hypothetical protein